MPLDSYANLQHAVLDWLARPEDPLVAPAVPDMITMFEEEARDRLQTRFGEKTTAIFAPTAIPGQIPLPLDYGELRSLHMETASGSRMLTYQTPVNYAQLGPYPDGFPAVYTIEGLTLYFKGALTDPAGSALNLNYLSGITGLSNTVTTNWLLTQYPSAYLLGTLAYAAPYIGDDPRLQVWLGGREATFARIQLADRRAKYPHTLMIQTDVRNP